MAPLSDTSELIDWPFERFPESAIEHSVWALFRSVAQRFADRLAVSDSQRSLTYAELERLARRVAAAVVAIDRPGPVAIFLPNEARYAAAILGTLAARRAFVALDADHPADRNALIARHAGAAAVVAADAGATVRGLFDGLPVIDIAGLPDADHEPKPGTPDDAAWIIYTSGSTGKPKGVWQNQRGFLHDVMQGINGMHLSECDRQLLFASPSLVSGLRVTLSSVLTGGFLACFGPERLHAPDLAANINAEHITVIRCVSALFRRIAQTMPPGGQLATVRLVLLGGDRVDWSDYADFRRICRPDAFFGVHLGATECSSIYVQWFFRNGSVRPEGRLPVGHNIADRTVALLDADGRPVADGEIGELTISSRYLARGYWNDAGLTAAAFTTDPIDAEVRTYQTGDFGLRRADGLYEHHGRRDDQIKIGGKRVEPGEIEAALLACRGVGDCAVVARRDEAGAAIAVIAYVELEPGLRGLLPRHIRAMLARSLPAHLLPATIFIVPALPRLPNLKIDGQRLRTIDRERSRLADDRATNPLLDEIASVFEQVIGRGGATPDDNILSLGGDSFQAVTLGLTLEQRFGVRLSDEILAAAPTVREVAAHIAPDRGSVVA